MITDHPYLALIVYTAAAIAIGVLFGAHRRRALRDSRRFWRTAALLQQGKLNRGGTP